MSDGTWSSKSSSNESHADIIMAGNNGSNGLLDNVHQLGQLNHPLLGNNLSNLGNLAAQANAHYSSMVDSNDSDDDDSKDSLKGSNSEINLNGDEGVWSPDIEQSFQEALAIYPPCGRRKIILTDEGKMYGRNELIARYIKLRTGKTRTRKQVSSHIQVLARRKAREVTTKTGNGKNGSANSDDIKPFLSNQLLGSSDRSANGHMSNSLAYSNTSGAQVPTSHHSLPTSAAQLSGQLAAVNSHANALGLSLTQSGSPLLFPQLSGTPLLNTAAIAAAAAAAGASAAAFAAAAVKQIASSTIRLVDFTAYIEPGNNNSNNSNNSLNSSLETLENRHIFVHIGTHPFLSETLRGGGSVGAFESIDLRQISDKFPQSKNGLKELYDRGPHDAFYLVKCWADLNIPQVLLDDPNAFYATTATYESNQSMVLNCSTKVCSFGKQVVEKVEVEYPTLQNGRYIYRIDRSQMCEYMVNFIHKLKDLPEKYMMNSVLENFTILQIITNRETNKTLLCIAFVFEVSVSEHGAQHHIYRLTSSEPPAVSLASD